MSSYCTDCALHQTSKCNCMLGSGPPQADIMIMGEAPGYNEEQQNLPFVGDAGHLLNSDFLPSAGLKREEVRVINAVRCRPPNNRDPEPGELNACRKYFVQEMNKVQPKLVILLGAHALKQALGLSGIMKHRGHLFQSPEFPGVLGLDELIIPIFVPTLHPAMALRSWEVVSTIKADFQKAVGILRGQIPIRGAGEYKTCGTIEEVRDILERLARCEEFAFDIETTGFNCRTDKILCFSFSSQPGTGWVTPLLGQYQQEVWTIDEKVEVFDRIRTAMASKARKIAQNGVFDILFCWANKIVVNNFTFDTLLADHLLDENRGHDLNTLISVYTTMPLYDRKLQVAWKEAKALRKKAMIASKKGDQKKLDELELTVDLAGMLTEAGENYSLIDPKILHYYAAADADATITIKQVQEPKLRATTAWKVFEEITMPMCQIVARLEWNGIPIDREWMFKHQDVLELERKDVEGRIFDALSREIGQTVEPFNTNSVKQNRETLIKQCKWPVVKATKTGASFDAGTLEIYRDRFKKEAAKYILSLREIDKRISTFLAGKDRKSGILAQIQSDGRIHPSYKLFGTVTGRLSTGIHNTVRKPAYLRGCFVPPPGWWWVELDYEQLELRILAVLSNDSTLQQWFREGRDVHAMVAAEVLGKAPEDVTAEERSSKGKPINFGLIYGEGVHSLARNMKVPIEEAERFLEAYFSRLSGVKRWFDNVMRELYATGRLVNVFGRIRHLHGASFYTDERISRMSNGVRKDMIRQKGEVERQGRNCQIQSTGNDILSKACLRTDKRLSDSSYQATYNHHHHDSFHLFILPEELVPVVGIVKEEMEKPVPELNGMSFPVSVSVGSRWYYQDEEATKWLQEQLK